jgi:3-mercaptopyruvate sulfurtransferase SseA
MRVKWPVAVALLLVVGTGLAHAAQMSPQGQDIPIELIRVKQVAQLLSDGARLTLVDVRSRQEYLARHIKGALSIPIDSVDARSRDIPREGIVVLY